ncbi:YciI family protein [Microbacterium sp.]|uniref:YciI family protein n=1 Tax=Microbacterium sp. TaxID=51671 RepID=UPI0028122BC1|nr:YciI family protein [Microbacterium sp.]
MSNQYLVIHMTDTTGAPLAQEDDQRILGQWAAEGQQDGRLHDGAPVAGPEAARSVAVRDGRVLVTDGPFPEFKEWFAGYDIINADSIEEAAAYMAKHPTAILGRIYILPVVALPWDES